MSSTSRNLLLVLREEDDSVERSSGNRLHPEGMSEVDTRLDILSPLRTSRVFVRFGTTSDVEIYYRSSRQCELNEQFSSSQNGYSMITMMEQITLEHHAPTPTCSHLY